jgi:cyclopropane-fatty-acyl-phospholipid synthase
MIEAVGRENLGEFFGKCAGLLGERGAMVLQGITMPDRDWDHYIRNPDFIQLRVFPGSSLVSLGSVSAAIAGSTDLRIDDVESLGAHYVTTLRIWRERFLERRDEARALGHDEKFLRLWDYYLAYCEAGFAEGYVDDVQIRLARPGWRAQ